MNNIIPFRQWDYEMVEKAFGLERVYDYPKLTKWLTAKHSETPREKKDLLALRNLLSRYVDDWNEMELQFHFLGLFMGKINFYNKKYNPFLQRNLTAKIKDIEVGGRVDFMVASGKRNPSKPYFFLHEYKKDKGTENDPLGQVLIAMLAAQTLNEQKEPIYGAYVVGRLWYFVILDGKEYAASLAYDATKDEIFEIFSILKQVKLYIEEMIAKGSSPKSI